MLQFQVIGNLGADAEFHSENGSQFVTFKVAHTDRFRDSQGKDVEETVWVSCVLNGSADKLRPYLLRGQRVYVSGDGSVRTFHSKKMQRLVAGCNLFVRQLELIGSRNDDVPRFLFDADGVQHQVDKYFHCPTISNTTLYNRQGGAYSVQQNGWVIPSQSSNEASPVPIGIVAGQSSDNDIVYDGEGNQTVEDANQLHYDKTQKKTGRSKAK